MKQRLRDLSWGHKIGWWFDRLILAPLYLFLVVFCVAITFVYAPGLAEYLYSAGFALLLVAFGLPALALLFGVLHIMFEITPNAAKAIRDAFTQQSVPMTNDNWVPARPIGPAQERL